MKKSILVSTNLANPKEPSPEFRKDAFDTAVWNKGYPIVAEKALRCPCHQKGGNLASCQNCFGTGYFYINATKFNALITSVNRNDQYKTWTDALLGTVAVTVTDDNKPNLGYYDRLTIQKEYSYFSELCEIRQIGDVFFIFTTYSPIDIYSVYIFVQNNEKLTRINYEKNPNNKYSIILPDLTTQSVSGVVSIYYKHEIEYHVLDYPHEVRMSWNKDKKTGKAFKIELPIQAIARRTHFIISEKPDYDGTGVILNDDVRT